MKELNLILETARIKELMNVQVLNEIKIPKGMISSIVRTVAKPVTFVGVADDELSKVLPKIAANKSDDVVLDFLVQADDVTGPQLKILLKIDDDEIRNALISAAGEDSLIKRLMGVLIAAEKSGSSSDISKAKSMVNKYMDDDVIDPIKNKVKAEIDADDLARQADVEGKITTRILDAQDELNAASKALDDFAGETSLSVFRNSELRKRLKTIFKRIKNLKEKDYQLLTSSMRRQLDKIESRVGELSPGVQDYFKASKSWYSDLSTIGKLLFWTGVFASPIGAWASQSDTPKKIIGDAICNFRGLIQWPCENGNPTTTTPPVVTPPTTGYANDENGLKKYISDTYNTDISLITVSKQSDGTWEASKSGGNKLKFSFNNGTFSRL